MNEAFGSEKGNSLALRPLNLTFVPVGHTALTLD
jgi:hypothetical protein